MNPSELGRALVALARGKKKTMTPAAFKQRQNASRASALKRSKTLPKSNENSSK